MGCLRCCCVVYHLNCLITILLSTSFHVHLHEKQNVHVHVEHYIQVHVHEKHNVLEKHIVHNQPKLQDSYSGHIIRTLSIYVLIKK